MPRPTVIKIAAWGERYVESMYRNILPCLTANGAAGPGAPVHLVIYTDGLSFKRLNDISLNGFRVTAEYLEVLPAPDDLAANRRLLAWTDAESIRIAKQSEADWLSFQADTLISNDFLPNIKELLGSHLAVAGAPIRTSTQRFEALVGAERDLNARVLRHLSLRSMHPVTPDYFMRDPPRMVPADPHQFFFKAGDGFVSRTWQPCPYGLSFEAVAGIASSEAVTIDCYLIPNLPPDRVHFQKPTDDFYLTSLDDESGIPTFGSFEMSPMGVALSINKFARDEQESEAYLRTLDQRFVYPPDTAMLPNDSHDEEVTVSTIKSFVRQMAGVK